MWPTFIILGRRISSVLVLPIAAVVGTIGYFIEQQLASRPKVIPYLESSVHDGRMSRQMQDELSPEYSDFHSIREEKRKIVPKSSLSLNTGRSGKAVVE
ncbi:hypothetical protein AB6A40_002431 [Gnathostoma spinigerum]|uniref:Small integral membrane protein 12 n=1 Tax=Gnathostoma spinigerum TaxID=75299 RepID=A0ABD6EGB0_9BILA